MKFAVTVYKPAEGGIDFPDEIARTRDLIIVSLASLMHLHGIARIQANAVSVGPETITQPKFEPIDDDYLPQQLKLLRNRVAKNVLDVLIAYGIHDIKLEPTEEETNNMRARWRYLEEGTKEVLP